MFVMHYLQPAPKDLFALPLNDPNLLNLQRSVDLWYQGLLTSYDSEPEHPIMNEPNPQCIAALLVLYLRMMPHPIIPPKLYWTFLRVGMIPHTGDRACQLRILVHKLPAASRELTLALIEWLNGSQLPVDFLCAIFAKILLRPTLEFGDQQIAPPPCLKVVCSLIVLAPFIAQKAEAPVIPTDPPANPAEFKLEGVALFDYTGNVMCIAS